MPKRLFNIFPDIGKLVVVSQTPLPVTFEIRGQGAILTLGKVQTCVFTLDDDRTLLLDYVSFSPINPIFVDDMLYEFDPRSLGQRVPNELFLIFVQKRDQPMELRFYTKEPQ